MITKNTENTTKDANVGAQRAAVAPEKAPSKKPTSPKKSAPKGQKNAKAAKPKPAAAAKPKKATPAKAGKPPKAAKPEDTGVPAPAAAGIFRFVPYSWRSCAGVSSLAEHSGQPPTARTCAACGETVANPCAACNSRSSPDQSASARHSPSMSGWPLRSCDLTAAISRRQRAIHAGSLRRSSAITSNVRPSPSREAFLPDSV